MPGENILHKSDRTNLIEEDVQLNAGLVVRQVYRESGQLYFVLAGEIKHDGSKLLERYLNDYIERHKPNRIVLDVAKLNFIDSQGLAMILDVQQKCKETNATLCLRRPLRPRPR